MTVQPPKQVMSESQYQMWRGVIAIAHVDGKMHDEERAYLRRTFQNLDRVYGLSVEQRKQLDDDMENPKDLATILPLITEPQFRGTLIHFGEVMVWADSEVSPEEEDVIKKLYTQQMSTIDEQKLRAEVKASLASSQAELERERAKTHATGERRSPVFRAIDGALRKLGIDILE
ncbi:MAG TPA: hypothetical protein VEF76_08320 [Patescibacteria group bacterium]|nr:hypothetical protein [Patescibacteria group bacterium]